MLFLNWFSRLIFGCCAIAAAWGAWYVVYQQSLNAVAKEEATKPQQAMAVEVVAARHDQIEERLILVGNLLPAAQTEIRSRVDGYILEMPFDVGDRVSAKDMICKLDASRELEALEQAKATLEAAKAQLGVQQSELMFALRNFERQGTLAATGANTAQELEEATGTLEVAKARVKLEEARVAEAVANVEILEARLGDFELIAPISGFIATRIADIGDLAKPDAPLMQIVDLERVLTSVNIIEKDFKKVAAGQVATVKVDAYPGRSFRGVVKRIAPVLDQETRTGAVQIEVQNPEFLLKPGMYARVSLNSEVQQSGVVVPLAAVLEANDRTYVFVVDNAGQTERREVILGSTDGNAIEVIQGIEEGELVITLGNRLVKPGQNVVARPVPWSVESSLSKLETENRSADEKIDNAGGQAPLAGD